ncbi:MAG: hypothetical protein ACP6IT_08645 [Candidatus Thorarchaeota archaeon]
MIQLWILTGDADIFAVMKRKHPLPNFIRRTGIWLGLIAMTLQSLAAMSHAGAMAAAVTGYLHPLSGALGLLQICTPLGIVEIDPRQRVPSKHRQVEQPCPLCSASALGGFTFTPVLKVHVPVDIQTFLIVVPHQISRMGFVSGRKGLSRAPPA